MFDRTRAVSSQISIMAAVPCVCDTLKKLVIDDVVASPSCDTVLIASSVVLGLGVMACIGLGLLKFTIKAVWPAKNLKKYGEWAVVTGATDGIGLAYAKQLARKGLNIVLISRSADKLEQSEKEIKEKCPKTEIRRIQADFSRTDAKLYADIKAALAGLDIGVLVNNVGMSYPSALYFHELDKIDPAIIDNMIAINVNATTQMTRIVLPGMIERKRGAVINVASAAGRIPIGNPLYAVYSASKAYVDYFSRSLHHEVKSFGVHVQCQSPYFVTSKMSKIRRASITVPNPDTYARAAVGAIGCGDSVVPFWTHAIQDTIVRALPHKLLSLGLVNMHRGIRKAFLKKRAADKKD